MSGWVASLRIARREAWLRKGRSLLVVVMIGLPVATIVFGAVAFRTLQLDPEQEVTRDIGTAADAFVGRPTGHVMAETPPGTDPGIWTGRRLPGPPPTIEQLVPDATGVLETRMRYGGGYAAPVVAGARRDYPSIRELEYTDPLAAGLVEQVSGRAPEALGEVVVTEGLAETLGVTPGDTLTVKAEPYDVVGVVSLRYGSDWSQVLGDPGAFPQVAFARQPTDANGWLVQVPGGLDYEAWRDINRQGSSVISREVAADPPDPCSPVVPGTVRMCGDGLSAEQREDLAEIAALTALIVVMAVLQVILIVGPAFAIGRRSQARDLALVSAVGGDARAVRRVVLAGGLVLGLVGGLAGLAVGVLAFQVLRPVVSNLAGTALFATDLNAELLIVLVVSTCTGVFAAWLPARAASRQDVVAALAGRRGAARTRRGVPVLGGIAVVVGVTIAFFGTTPGNATFLLLGAVVAELGLVALAPWLVGVVARLARSLPAAPRLALRDAGRNRLRAGTAVAAVLAAVAGATALGVYVASDAANAERHHVAVVPEGYIGIKGLRGAWPGGDITSAVATLPADATAPMIGTESSCMFLHCDGWRVERTGPACDWASSEGGTPACSYSFGSPWRAWMRGDATTYQALTGFAPDRDIDEVLAAGGVVVAPRYAEAFVHDGVMRFEHRATGEVVELRAHVAPPDETGERPRFELLLAPDAWDMLGLEERHLGYTVITSRAATAPEVAVAREALASATDGGQLVVGAPYQPSTQLPLLLLLGAAVLLAVAATATAVGLAGADARPDLATLAAVGASPRMRRWLSASHAALVSGLGTALGVLAGVVVGAAAIGSTTDNRGEFMSEGGTSGTLPLTIPWESLGVLTIVVPLVAVVLAFCFSRSRLPMVRRLD